MNADPDSATQINADPDPKPWSGEGGKGGREEPKENAWSSKNHSILSGGFCSQRWVCYLKYAHSFTILLNTGTICTSLAVGLVPNFENFMAYLL